MSEALQGLIYGLGVATVPANLLAALMGALLGTAIGVLPGLGPVAGVALILPLTFTFDPTVGLIMMAGIYYGSLYGGSTTGILINIPGEAPSIVTAIDGHQMTLKGRGGAALTLTAVASFVGGTIAVIGVLLFSPVLSEIAIVFGPSEFFALTAGGLLVLSRITGGSFASGFLPMVLGLAMSTVGVEAVSGYDRFTFGTQDLLHGFSLVPVVVGAFGVAEILMMVDRYANRIRPPAVGWRDLVPTREEVNRSWLPWGRGTIIGFLFGLLPGPSATMSSFAAYRLEKAVSKNRDKLGTGAVEGICGPEAANNAAATSSLVPLLALGLPFSTVGALMIAAMMVQGIQPGPLLLIQHPDIFWGVIVSCYIGNIMLLVLNIPMVGIWVKMLTIPTHILISLIIVIASIGAFSVHNAIFDVWVLCGMGLVGYFLRKMGFHLAPLVVALMLGPIIEKHFREALYLSNGDLTIFVESAISVILWIVVLVLMLTVPLAKVWQRMSARRGTLEAD
ncbi:hypothetical protein GCM10011360_36760 [Primorskyibacter flagellatus]|uniref:DUF112 domain-containing protein n=1 Tax=Primorskyibacter flagellatus TaxID=1387277 RepID=A0A917AE34_9RHOB|nr:tripartite tricarboxylate transporter permease [Primorskyibacter flagellatus]GGE46115.1 hypothetical protein GCM10011360_36760 [Primorskyibacter flagellatus]